MLNDKNIYYTAVLFSQTAVYYSMVKKMKYVLEIWIKIQIFFTIYLSFKKILQQHQ